MRYWRTLKVEDRGRRRLGIAPIDVVDDTTQLVDRVAADQAQQQVHSILAALPDGQREAIRLRVIDELTYQEIAERVGCGAGAARVRVHRGLKALRNELEASWNQEP